MEVAVVQEIITIFGVYMRNGTLVLRASVQIRMNGTYVGIRRLMQVYSVRNRVVRISTQSYILLQMKRLKINVYFLSSKDFLLSIPARTSYFPIPARTSYFPIPARTSYFPIPARTSYFQFQRVMSTFHFEIGLPCLLSNFNHPIPSKREWVFGSSP